MPKSKRAPIEYTPQFAAGIFRPREVIEDELEGASDDATASVDTAPAPAPTSNRSPRQSRSNERTVERTKERTRVRHSFDVWQDQLLALAEIQARLFSQTGRKPKVGELVQEALDAYIAAHTKKTNERSNERTT